MNEYLSYIMGVEGLEDGELTDIGVHIVETKSDGDRCIKIPKDKLAQYKELIKARLGNGFWNEMVGEKEIIFIFKFKDGSIKEMVLSLEKEREVSKLCSEFCGESEDNTANVYKFLAGNSFYKDFMSKHYSELIGR